MCRFWLDGDGEGGVAVGCGRAGRLVPAVQGRPAAEDADVSGWEATWGGAGGDGDRPYDCAEGVRAATEAEGTRADGVRRPRSSRVPVWGGAAHAEGLPARRGRGGRRVRGTRGESNDVVGIRTV